MYSVKGSWAGQTFALAATDDSGGKKSRIRRSKAERKTMVETFIKRYQSSNNGNFPSLNLTHKEVGGSFYTVREIVREIIQENRVLGPGQCSSKEQVYDTIAGNYPLGTISCEPQGLLFKTGSELNAFSNQEGNENMVQNLDNNEQYTRHFKLDAVHYSTEHHTDEIGEDPVDELVSNSTSESLVISDHQEQASLGASWSSNGPCFSVNETDNVHSVSHMQTNGILKESDKQLAVRSSGYETFKTDENLGKMDEFQAKLTLPTEEVEIETFPLRPAITKTDDLGSRSTDSKILDGKFDDLVLDKGSSFDSTSELTTKGADDSEASVSGSPNMMTQHTEVNHMLEVNLQNDSVDKPYLLSMKDDTAILHDCMNQISQHGDSASKAAEQNNPQLQSKNGSKGSSYLENNNARSSKNVRVNGKDFKRDEKAMVGSSPPPLDRIELESWTASKQETNPLLTLFKAFVDAFVRFWSE